MGFEPMVGCDTHTDLANRRFRPLSHLSQSVCWTPNLANSIHSLGGCKVYLFVAWGIFVNLTKCPHATLPSTPSPPIFPTLQEFTMAMLCATVRSASSFSRPAGSHLARVTILSLIIGL